MIYLITPGSLPNLQACPTLCQGKNICWALCPHRFE